MRLTVAVFLLACGVAVAAPVPKATTPKLEDLFGEVADKNSVCKYQMSKGGVLTITVPTSHPQMEPSGESHIPPLVGRKIEGDFELTVRMAASTPNGAKPNGSAERTAVFAGVSVVSDDDSKLGVTTGLLRMKWKGKWPGVWYGCHNAPGRGGVWSFHDRLDEDAPLYLRFVRRGDRVTVEMSADGQKWVMTDDQKVDGLVGAVRVGPAVYQSTDQEFTATFDQYEIKLLKKDEKK